jgi:hypothetical protein
MAPDNDTRIFGSFLADSFEAWVAFRYVLVMKLRGRTPDGIAERMNELGVPCFSEDEWTRPGIERIIRRFRLD